ncbi:MAG: acyl-CoA dehydrogenase [Alphaproteobacteria bacterium]|nr:acyl-CoA dehydrogenase [Alphaproteobacteria bacterium]
MDFSLTDDERAIQETFARFADAEIAPKAAQIDEAHEFPTALFKKVGELGFFRMRYPESVGGLGLGFVPYCLAVEELARGSMAVAAACAMQSLMATHFLHELGNADIKERLFKPALDGDKIGAICMTEPNAGSDLHGMRTRAKAVAGGWSLTGQKMWVTSAPLADFFTVFAKAAALGENEEKITIFLVEKGSQGLHVGRAIEKMGVKPLITSELAFDECFVPESQRLSVVGEGEKHLRKILAQIRIMTGALGLGIARAALDAAVQYSNERKQFGKPIGSFQAIQMRLADMGTELEAARHLVRYAAWLVDRGQPHHKEAAMAKLFATETAAAICEHTSRIFASYGFAMEYPAQRFLRDVRFLLIGGGTSEILKLIIAKEVAGRG